MDLDNIKDIEVLKTELKKHMVKIKVPIECDNRFKVGHWYRFNRDKIAVIVYCDDEDGYFTISLSTARKYLDFGNNE